MKLKRQFRSESVDLTGLDKEKRTLTFPFSSEFAVDRWFGEEILSHEPGSADLSRLKDGGAVLWNHRSDTVIGVVESAELRSDKRGWATIRFSKNAKADEVMRDVEDKILRGVSFGYQVKEMKLLNPQASDNEERKYLATKWMPFEVSIVSIPADPTVGIGRADSDDEMEVRILRDEPIKIPSGGNKMDEEQKKAEAAKREAEIKQIRDEERKAERERVAAIQAMGEKFEQRDLARQLVESGASVDEARKAVMEQMGSRQKPITGKEGEIGLTDREKKNFSFIRAINALANPGSRKLREAAAFEFDCSAAAIQARGGKEAQGLLVPFDVLSYSERALSKGTPSAGGYLVATDHLASSFIEMLRKRSILNRAGVFTMSGLVGDCEIPKQTGAGTAYWVGEATDPTTSSQTFGQVALSPKTVGTYTDLSRKLLIQGTPDAENLVKSDLAKVIALETDRVGLYGSGSASQPQGIAGGSFVTGLNTKDLASATTMSFPEAVDMETLISADNADVETMKYLASSVMRGGMKGTVKFSSTDSITVWQDGNTINGYGALCSNQIQDPDVFFGDWSQLIIGQWSGIDLNVDTSALAKQGGLRVIVLQDMDVAVRHGESFCYANSSIS